MNEHNLPQTTSYTALPTSTTAIVSLIAGILGFNLLPLIGTVVALVAGYAARKETRAAPPTASGDGYATAGIIMGWIQVALAIIGGFCLLLFFLILALALGTSINFN